MNRRYPQAAKERLGVLAEMTLADARAAQVAKRSGR